MKSVIVWNASFRLASPSFKNTGPNNSTIFNRRIEASVLEVITYRKLQHVLRSHKHEAFQKERYKLNLRTFAPIATVHLLCVRYTWRGACHVMYFKHAHLVETQQNIELMTFAVTWSANIFVGCSVTPTFFFGRSLPFLILSIILKNRKNLYVGSFNYFSFTIQIRPNWYMDTGVCDLEHACFKANSTWINDIGSKDLSNRPIYAVLNTQYLDMILQLKYMLIVMNLARIASSDWKS